MAVTSPQSTHAAHNEHGHVPMPFSERHKQHRRRLSRSLGGRRRHWLLAGVLTFITLGSGIINLLSVMGGPPYAQRFLREIFPIEFFRLSRTATMLIGFALIVSSLNIFRRKRRAWAIVLGLSSFSALLHLVRLDYQEAIFSGMLAILLGLARKTFTVKSAVPDLLSGVLRLLLSAAVALGYGIAGFWLLDERHFAINFHLNDAVWTTLRFLALSNDPRLTPHTHYAQWFLDSLYLIAITAIVYSGFVLFRPVVYRFRELPRERAAARQIVRQYGRTTQDFFKLWPDKSYFFSPSHRCFIAYRVAGDVALALGDPVGPEEEIELTVREFLEMCHENGWAAGLHQALPDFLPIYRRARLNKLKIGDDAIVDLPGFSLAGKAMKEFRYKVRQLEGMGLSIVEYQPPLTDEVIAQLEQVSADWLRIPGRRERTFTLGQFDPAYLRETPILAVVDGDGRMLAFLNVIAGGNGEITGDLMRRRSDAPNGVMDYLFVKTFLRQRELGYKCFNLGMAPMAGFQEREEATVEERAIHSFFQQLNFLFSFRGLRYYKAKFATHWEPRYLIYRNALELPRLALALRRVSEIPENTVARTWRSMEE